MGKSLEILIEKFKNEIKNINNNNHTFNNFNNFKLEENYSCLLLSDDIYNKDIHVFKDKKLFKILNFGFDDINESFAIDIKKEYIEYKSKKYYKIWFIYFCFDFKSYIFYWCVKLKNYNIEFINYNQFIDLKPINDINPLIYIDINNKIKSTNKIIKYDKPINFKFKTYKLPFY